MEIPQSLKDPSLQEELITLNQQVVPKKNLGNISGLSQRIAHMVSSGGGVTAFDLERFIGSNDLVKANFLERGMSAAKSVCRIFVADTVGSGGCWGTGFLIAPNLLITNHHVIGTENEAYNSFVEFEYEANIKGILKQGKRFKLNPQIAFIRSLKSELDFVIVGVELFSEDGMTPLSNYGFLRLSPEQHKVVESEFVTIIQHPNGDQKYIALRENKVTKIGDNADSVKKDFIWYSSDTAKGASGAPTFNDNWQVVAVHHRAVPLTKVEEGETFCQLIDGSWKKQDEVSLEDDSLVKFIANEGIRVSSIVTKAIELYNNLPDIDKQKFAAIKALIDDATGVKSFPSTIIGESINQSLLSPSVLPAFEAYKASKNIRPVEFYQGRTGYDERFLKTIIPFPKLTAYALSFGEVLKTLDTQDDVLKYTHFSVQVNKDRKMPFYTVVNIDGKKWRNIKRGDDKWFYDPRIPLEFQVGDEFYGNEPQNLGKKGYFDRGHLVRRQDPDWGTMQEAALADEDSFHWTNCSPQYWGFNQSQDLWQGLENYILYNTDQENVKATVFSGPVFSESDEEHRGVLVPQHYWKLVIVDDKAENLYASAYVVSQKKYAVNIPFEELPISDFNNFQISISKLQALTGLDFGEAVRSADVIRTVTTDIGLRSLADIRMARRT